MRQEYSAPLRREIGGFMRERFARIIAPEGRGAIFQRRGVREKRACVQLSPEMRLKMSVERTLSLIKPDAVAKNLVGAIYRRFEEAGLKIVAAKMLRLSEAQAAEFYAAHKEKPFFGELVAFMVSGPIMAQVLEGENAVAKTRKLMGATFPKDAEPGTIRADFCDAEGDQGENAVHGSDAPDAAAAEIAFFFTEGEICPRSR